jgi:hypothetical protein
LSPPLTLPGGRSCPAQSKRTVTRPAAADKEVTQYEMARASNPRPTMAWAPLPRHDLNRAEAGHLHASGPGSGNDRTAHARQGGAIWDRMSHESLPTFGDDSATALRPVQPADRDGRQADAGLGSVWSHSSPSSSPMFSRIVFASSRTVATAGERWSALLESVLMATGHKAQSSNCRRSYPSEPAQATTWSASLAGSKATRRMSAGRPRPATRRASAPPDRSSTRWGAGPGWRCPVPADLSHGQAAGPGGSVEWQGLVQLLASVCQQI